MDESDVMVKRNDRPRNSDARRQRLALALISRLRLGAAAAWFVEGMSVDLVFRILVPVLVEKRAAAAGGRRRGWCFPDSVFF